jgi:hypothetical protein
MNSERGRSPGVDYEYAPTRVVQIQSQGGLERS